MTAIVDTTLLGTTLHAKLQEVAELYAQQIFARTRNGEKVVEATYQEFYRLAEKIAHGLIALGVKPNDKVAIILENRIEWGAIYFGILMSGAIAVPLDLQANLDDLKFFCHDAECCVAFVAYNVADKMHQLVVAGDSDVLLKNIIALDDTVVVGKELAELSNSSNNSNSASGGVATVTVAIAFTDFIRRATDLTDAVDGLPPLPARCADDIASILYTSGTTGIYKGVMLSHHNFLANYFSITQLSFPIYHQHFLALLPLHHSLPFIATLILPLFAQGKVTYLNSLKSDELLRCLQQDGVTIFVGVPQLFYMLYKSIAAKLKSLPFWLRWPLAWMREAAWWLRKYTRINLSKLIFASLHRAFGQSMQFWLSGGARLDTDVALFFMQLGFNLVEGYGLTETAPVVTFNFDTLHHLGAAGKPLPGVAVKINIAPSSSAPSSRHIGEILIRGGNVMQGYYKHAAATAEAIKDDWFYSGDLGYIDRDGYLYITGRQKEIIVLSSGKNISPEELEVHYGHSRYIKEVCITLGGSNMEEKLLAIVVPDVEYCQQIGKVDIYNTVREELEMLSKSLAPYKRIMGFIITKDALLRTRLGKLRRFLIQEKYRAELLRVALGEDVALENGGGDGDGDGGAVLARRGKQERDLSESDLALLSQPVTQQVLQLLSGLFGHHARRDKAMHLDDHLEIDLGIESLGRVELFVALEKRFAIKMAEDALSKIATVRELIALVNTQLQMPAAVASNAPAASVSIATTTWHNILKNELSSEVKNKILLDFNLPQRFSFSVFNVLLKSILYLGWRLKVRGVENLPLDKPFILCSNHLSFLDAPAIAAALPAALQRQTFFMGLKEIFVGTALQKFIRLMKVIPVDPGAELVAAMQACAYVLRQGKVVCIFPEGGRSADGMLKEFKKGVGILAAELNVPLVPVCIGGTYEAWPRTARYPKPHKITVTFGKAVTPQELMTLAKAKDVLPSDDYYTVIAKGIRAQVELCSCQR
jgi:long-chain acyl-CoA synthetase